VVAAIVANQFARLIAGRDCSDIAEAWEMCFSAVLPFDRSGVAMMAVAAVDLALWDLEARIGAAALLDLLGGCRHARLPAYVTTVRPEAFAGSGFRGIKIPIPFGPEGGEDGIRANIAAVAAARAAAGPDRDVAIDVFMAWDVDYTLRMAEALRPYRLRWIEDPLPPTDIDAYVRLHRGLAGETALALGNFCFSRWDCLPLLEAGVAGVLQPDVAWAGGLTECRRIAELAARRNVPVILHNAGEQPWAMTLSAALPAATEIEHVDRGDGSLLHGLFDGGPAVADGWVAFDPPPPPYRLSAQARARLVPARGTPE
jgi:L-rhamnonate dehydratase